MTKAEALESLLSKIDNPEDFDEEIAVLSETVSETVSDTVEKADSTEDSYRARYEKLKEAYKNRFGEMLNQTLEAERQRGMDLMSNEVVQETTDIKDLDWDGSTE